MSIKQNKKSSLTLITLALLLLAIPALSKISAWTDKLEPFTFVGTKSHYQYTLDKAFDFKDGVYPMTVKASNLGQKVGFTHQDEISELNHTTPFTEIKSLIFVDHSKFIISGSFAGSSRKEHFVTECGSPISLTNPNCKNIKIVMDKSGLT